MMKRILTSALLLGAVSGFGLVGCADTAKEEVKTTTETPTGTTTEKTTHEVKTTESGGAATAPSTTPATPK